MTTPRFWIYGHHTVNAALNNPQRLIHKVASSDNQSLKEMMKNHAHRNLTIEKVEKSFFQKTFGPLAVHQNIAAYVDPLPTIHLEDFLQNPPTQQAVAVLDQITDPHNIGAILRSAAAFNIHAIILTHHHSPQQWGVVAKSASGALERVTLIMVTNLARSLEQLKQKGFWCIGLSGEGKDSLSTLKRFDKTALIFGSEGKGMRKLTETHCDVIARIPTSNSFSTLNVSNAAAVAFFALTHFQNNQSQ